MDSILCHYGTKRHSGRYPWGSGEEPYQHDGFLKQIQELKGNGFSEKDIANYYGMSIQELRNQKTLARDRYRHDRVMQAVELKNKGWSNTAIANRMGVPESTIRNYIKDGNKPKEDAIKTVTGVLKDVVDEKNHIDIGSNSELALGITPNKLKAAVQDLQNKGYIVSYIQVPQLGTNYKTTVKVLSKPDGKTPKDIYKELYNDMTLIKTIDGVKINQDGIVEHFHPPIAINKERIFIRYGDEGGSEKDGLIEIRKGADDLDLGDSMYAQVRVAVEGNKYMKGMAMYTNDIPNGYDVVYNTNKPRGSEKVFKNMDDDPSHPFGGATASIYDQRGALNILNEEGKWTAWSKTLSAQMLSKQDISTIKKQLSLSLTGKQSELEDIKALTNPTIKKMELLEYADDCDASAVHLKATSFPRQASYVILPIQSLKDDEVYAPKYQNGEEVALIRYPHGGIFEIPVLKVNNKQKEAKDIMGNAQDAIGINSKVAQILSGADFDGDTVTIIPLSNKVKLKSVKDISDTKPLEELRNFDPKTEYAGYPGMKVMKEEYKQKQMGIVSNLITDMTIKGAPTKDIVKAVKHSMVVIDAVKHELDYKRSYQENDIARLKKEYQDGGGAATLISRAKNPTRINKRSPYTSIDPETGEKIFKETGEVSYKTGKPIQQDIPRMSVAKDANELSSGTPKETIYASYANRLKSLANQARKEAMAIKDNTYDPSAHKIFSKEVESINAKLMVAKKNAPKERQAQILANVIYKGIESDNPHLTSEQKKKYRGLALSTARARTNAKKERVVLNDDEWKAIQAGAITKTKLIEIWNHSDKDAIKKRALPKQTQSLSSIKVNRINALNNSGYTIAEIAETMNVSPSTISRLLKEN